MQIITSVEQEIYDEKGFEYLFKGSAKVLFFRDEVFDVDWSDLVICDVNGEELFFVFSMAEFPGNFSQSQVSALTQIAIQQATEMAVELKC